MRRREFLAGGAGLVGIGAAGRAASAPEVAPVIRSKPAAYLVPGYRTDLAHYRGRAVEEAPDLRRALPADYRGPTTIVTRIDEADGSVRRALMPIRGHAIALRLGGGSADAVACAHRVVLRDRATGAVGSALHALEVPAR